MEDIIIIYTDGGARGNGKTDCVSAWAYTLTYGTHYKENKGAVYGATNNQMEMTAIIQALRSVRRKDISVKLHSDSEYCIKGITSWIHNWKKKGWVNSKKEPVENKELWIEMEKEANEFKSLEFIKVKGHADVPGNIRVDALVNEAMDELISSK